MDNRESKMDKPFLAFFSDFHIIKEPNFSVNIVMTPIIFCIKSIVEELIKSKSTLCFHLVTNKFQKNFIAYQSEGFQI